MISGLFDARDFTRRHFLRALGLAGAAVVALRPRWASAALAPADQATLGALANVIIPADDSAGAVDAGALSALALGQYAQIAVELGWIPQLPPELQGVFGEIDQIVASLIVADLDGAANRLRGVPFVSLSPADQIAVTQDRFTSSPVAPVYQLVRAACFIAYLGAPSNDLGLQAIGLPPYQSFTDYLASSGYPDYSFNAVPSVNGTAVWDITVNGDLP